MEAPKVHQIRLWPTTHYFSSLLPICERMIYISDMSQLRHSVYGDCLLPWVLIYVHTTHIVNYVSKMLYTSKYASNMRIVYLKHILACCFYVIPKDIPDSFLSTYLPPFFGQIHQRVSEVKKNTFKSIFDMGHKYNVIGHTHTHTRHPCAPKLTWMHACTNIRTTFVCVFCLISVFFSTLVHELMLWLSMLKSNPCNVQWKKKGREKRLNLAKG